MSISENDGFYEAIEAFEEDPFNNPLPLPCSTDSCDGYMMKYDAEYMTYVCPICGRKVKWKDREKYLERMVKGRKT